MKIAFYAPMKPPGDPVPSGDGRMADLFLRALEQAGFSVELASRFRAYEGKGDAERQRRVAADGADEAERLVARYRTLPADERPAAWFTYHLYHKAPDHLGPVVSAALNIPYVVAEASRAPKQAAGPWAEGYRAAGEAIATAALVCCLNPVDRACLLPAVRDSSVLRDLAPFIDTAPFRTGDRDAARAALRRRYDLDPDAPIVLTVAMMRADQKLRSYAVLLDALRRVADRRWNALLVGDGEALPEVQELAASLGNRVFFAGRLEGENLLGAYRGADLYAWPSVKEAFGLAFIEAAAAGLPVVAGRSGGIDRIVDDGRTGFIVPAGDAEALADRLRSVLDAPDLRRRMGLAAAGRALRVNDVGVAADVLGRDIRRLLADA